MQITKDNIGDVICKYQNGKRIMITDVDDTHVHYLNESLGCRCITNQFSIVGTVDLSPGAKEEFLNNWNLAKTLEEAKISSLRKMFTGTFEDKERADDNFSMVTDFQKDFYNNISNDSLARKEYLLKMFLIDLKNAEPGQKMFFYKQRIEKPIDSEGYIVNGCPIKKEELKVFLSSNQNQKIKKLSFDELVNSAQKRSEDLSENNRSQNKVKEEFTMDK